MILNFSPRTGKIEKETKNLGNVSVTIDDARAAWLNGEVENCNIAFQRLATEYDFNVEACLAFYKQQT